MSADQVSKGLQERMVTWLAMIVPLKIAEMAESYHEGPSVADWERLDQCIEKWWTGAKDDSGKGRIMADAWVAGIDADTTPREREQIREMRLDIAHALSVMAWCPGGVKIFGVHIHAPIRWGTEDGRNFRLPGWTSTYPFGWFVQGEIPFETICEAEMPVKVG